jgi:hypothetical protein
MYSFLGKYEEAIETYNHRYNEESLYTTELNLSGKESSQEDLIHLYKKFQVVLFNEAHHVPMHRAFLFNQLNFLRDCGYTHLAIEGLNNGKYSDSTLVARKYPLRDVTGVYINEPVFGLLVRQAIKLGFKLISYDSYGTDREKKQADNILKSFNPEEGKLIVYGGYGHICEDINQNFMAGFLKKSLECDVLTLSQTLPLKYKPITNADDCCEFYLLERSNKCYDYSVIPNAKPNRKNIPYWYDWLNCSYERLSKLVNVEPELPCLIQFYDENESENAVPLYQYLIEQEAERDILIPVFSKGKYRVKLINGKGEVERSITL